MTNIKPNRFAKIVAFANRQFSEGKTEIDFLKIQPKIYCHPGQHLENHFIHEENHEIAGLIGTYPTEYLGLKLLGVGTVCVDSQYRNLGIMQKMFADLHREIEPKYDLIYLSGEKTRYEHLGFYKTGRLVKFRIKLSSFKNMDLRILTISPYTDNSPAINEKLNEFYSSKANPIRREEGCYLDVLKTHNAEVFLIGEKDLSGYIVYNRQKNTISEVVLKNEGIEAAIFNFMMFANLREVNCEVSADDENIGKLHSISEESFVGTLLNIKIVNFPKVIATLLSKRLPLPEGKLNIRIVDRVTIQITIGKTVEVNETGISDDFDIKLSEKEFHELLFSDFALFYPERQNGNQLIKSWFPLSLPATLHSIDSI